MLLHIQTTLIVLCTPKFYLTVELANLTVKLANLTVKN